MPHFEQLSSSWDRLTPGMQIYLRGFLEGSFRLPSEVPKRLPLLLSPETALQRLGDAIHGLEALAVTPETATNPRAQKGWEILAGFTRTIEKQLRRHEATVFVYGSLRFDDPQNLDFDCALWTIRESPALVQTAIDVWEPELLELWTAVGSDDGHLPCFSLEQLRHYCQNLDSNDLGAIREQSEQMWLDFSFATIPLTGFPLFAPDCPGVGDASHSPFVQKLREEILGLTKEQPVLAAEMCLELEECLRIRQDRRQ